MERMYIPKMYGGQAEPVNQFRLSKILNIEQMKKIKILSLLTLLILLGVSCSTQEDDPAGLRGVAVVPGISNLNPGAFDSKDLANTYVQFTLDIPKGTSVSKATIQVSYNGQKERVEFATVNTFPATIKVSLADAVSKLGMSLSDVKLGDIFNIEVLTTTDGKTYYSNSNVDAAVVCAYNPALASGSYHAKSSDWGVDGDVNITVDPNDQYTVYVSGLETIDGLDEDKGPLKMVIDPATYSVQAEKTVLASSTSGWGPTSDYHNIAYTGSGTYSSCDGTYVMAFDISVDEGDFGTYHFTLTKN